MNPKAFRRILRDTLPVMTGYLFLGAGFGILLNQHGYGIGWAFFMSLFMYAGSAQYLAVSLMTGQAGLLAAGVATFLLNARHIFYGISLVDTYKDTGLKKGYLIFGLTDETYSLVTQNEPPEGISRHSYYLWVTLMDHIYWITGSVLGSEIGGIRVVTSLENIDRNIFIYGLILSGFALVVVFFVVVGLVVVGFVVVGFVVVVDLFAVVVVPLWGCCTDDWVVWLMVRMVVVSVDLVVEVESAVLPSFTSFLMMLHCFSVSIKYCDDS